jgi:hypothetical protein
LPETPSIQFDLNAVVVAVRAQSSMALDTPLVLCRSNALESLYLPGGKLAFDDQTFERAMRRVIVTQTQIEVGYAEQLYTFGDANRSTDGKNRSVSSCYLALVRDHLEPTHSAWQPIYHFLPWEDWRLRGMPQLLLDSLQHWAQDSTELQERVAIAFGLDGCALDSERVLDRYELLWQAGLIGESIAPNTNQLPIEIMGQAMHADHRRMLACALGRLRGKLKYRPVVFELLPESFTMLKLQRTTEALIGQTLHKQNFRRLVETEGLLEPCGESVQEERGRPAALYRFRKAVFRERPAPGVRV